MKLKKSMPAIICIISAIIIVALFSNGVIVTDRSAVYSAEGLSWNGAFYKSCSGYCEEGKTIAKTADRNWDINEVEGDPEHNFVVVRSVLDDFLYVRNDYAIPDSGTPSIVCFNSNKIEDSEFSEILSDIYSSDTQTVSITATNGDVQNWKSVSIGFDGCPVAVFRGYIGFTDGKYFFTVDLSDIKEKDDGSGTPFTVVCKPVDENYYSMLEEHFD